jgi:DNA polymerase IV
LDPALRGKPVGVAPVMAESSCCIAASYEAKAFGVKTGTRISDARLLCPGIVIVEAKPPEYIRYHHQIIAAVEDCIHVEAVLSIDEMWAWLPYNLREPETVEAIGRRIKDTVARDVSPVIKVSVGAGPNRYLAKTASKIKKPDWIRIEVRLKVRLLILEFGTHATHHSHEPGPHSASRHCPVRPKPGDPRIRRGSRLPSHR